MNELINKDNKWIILFMLVIIPLYIKQEKEIANT